MKSTIEKDPIAFQMKSFFALIIFIVSTALTGAGLYWNLVSKISINAVWGEHILEMLNDHEDRIVTVEHSNNKLLVEIQRIKQGILDIQATLKEIK